LGQIGRRTVIGGEPGPPPVDQNEYSTDSVTVMGGP
jgi:hypothetical protein